VLVRSRRPRSRLGLVKSNQPRTLPDRDDFSFRYRYKCKYNDLKKLNTYYVDSLGIVETFFLRFWIGAEYFLVNGSKKYF
jgi:hypothetical protein